MSTAEILQWVNLLLLVALIFAVPIFHFKQRKQMSDVKQQIQESLAEINETTNQIADTTTAVVTTLEDLRNKVVNGGMSALDEQEVAATLAGASANLKAASDALKLVAAPPAGDDQGENEQEEGNNELQA